MFHLHCCYEEVGAVRKRILYKINDFFFFSIDFRSPKTAEFPSFLFLMAIDTVIKCQNFISDSLLHCEKLALLSWGTAIK